MIKNLLNFSPVVAALCLLALVLTLLTNRLGEQQRQTAASIDQAFTAYQLPAAKPAPKFRDIDDVKARKAAFFNYFGDIVNQINAQVLARRNGLDSYDKATITSLCEHYKAPCTDNVDKDRSLLRNHIDAVPLSLVLSQAANESAWGTSRFAMKGNNYFGEWCFSRGCGLVPKQRSDGAHNEVRVFDSPSDSVASYIHNINTSHAYTELRALRAQLRTKGKILSGLTLAEGLTRYSARGDDYVAEIKAMIRFNKLAKLDEQAPNIAE